MHSVAPGWLGKRPGVAPIAMRADCVEADTMVVGEKWAVAAKWPHSERADAATAGDKPNVG